MSGLADRIAGLVAPRRRELQQLSKRVARLEAEVQETQRFGRRLAELADLVQELLVPAANRDDERLRRLLDEYSKRL